MDRLFSLEDLQKAWAVVEKSSLCYRTPMLKNVQDIFGFNNINLHLKLENLQNTGSFKPRGLAYQLANLPNDVGTEEKKIVTMSAGNYGKAFAVGLHKLQLKGLVCMPDTAPLNRAELIKSYGLEVERVPVSTLSATVDNHVLNGMFYLHSFDEPYIIAGHSSLGKEIIEDCPDPDIIIVCCGGGGLVAGVSAAVKRLVKKDCRIYAVEPEGSNTMYESFKAGHAVTNPHVKSVASGLSPPFAGTLCYRYCREFLEDVLLVSDSELIDTMFYLFENGLKVEPAGCAAFAALRTGKVPDTDGKNIVVVITGGNVSLDEMMSHKKS